MNNDLDKLEDKIDAARPPEGKSETSGGGVQAGAEFISPILGGLLIGYFLDKWLETEPIFLISLFLLGVGAGFVSIYRASQDIGSSVGYSELHQREKDAKNAPNTDKNKNNSE